MVPVKYGLDAKVSELFACIWINKADHLFMISTCVIPVNDCDINILSVITVWIISVPTGGLEDVDSDSGDVCVEEFLHHYGNVSADSVLRLPGGHFVWYCQAWEQPGKVGHWTDQ